MSPPRFTIDRKTGCVTWNKPFAKEEIKELQVAVVKSHAALHPEIFVIRSEQNGRSGSNDDG